VESYSSRDTLHLLNSRAARGPPVCFVLSSYICCSIVSLYDVSISPSTLMKKSNPELRLVQPMNTLGMLASSSNRN
jgi:hypothetical protein